MRWLDALDGKHAAATMNDTPLGEIVSHGCQIIGAVFQVLTVLTIVGVHDSATRWSRRSWAEGAFVAAVNVHDFS